MITRTTACLLCAPLLGICAPPLAAQELDANLIRACQLLEELEHLEPTKKDGPKRGRLFNTLIKNEDILEDLLYVVDLQLAAVEQRYVELLELPLREQYLERLKSLGKGDLRSIARTRRVWRNYTLTTATQFQFQQYFLDPCVAMGKLLLPEVEMVKSKALAVQRALMQEYALYQARCHAAIGIDPDPTQSRMSPTGIALPYLNDPPTYEDYLSHLHRTVVLTASIAPQGARKALLANAAAAKQIDVEESEFVLFANEVRMLTGTIAWVVDPIVCACGRDHSQDRKDGKASGHRASVPGKRGMGDRLRRFGTTGRSEGAGGGRNGRGYLRGLSYGGGHTGPLYSLKRNVVGVGRRANVYTSIYRTDKEWLHACHATENELFMLPGLTFDDIGAESLQEVYRALQDRCFGEAQRLIDKASVSGDLDKTLLRYFGIVIDIEIDWLFECLARIEAVGDLHSARERFERDRTQFEGIEDKRFTRLERRLSKDRAAKIIEAGEAYHVACDAKDQAALRAFVEDHKGSVYAAAAMHLLDAGLKPHRLAWFLTQDKHLNRFEYLR